MTNQKYLLIKINSFLINKIYQIYQFSSHLCIIYFCIFLRFILIGSPIYSFLSFQSFPILFSNFILKSSITKPPFSFSFSSSFYYSILINLSLSFSSSKSSSSFIPFRRFSWILLKKKKKEKKNLGQVRFTTSPNSPVLTD